MELARELNRLEQPAAVVGRLLRDADEATIQQAVAGWAPLKPKSYQPRRWDAFWLEWLVECSERLPPAEAERVKSLLQLCGAVERGVATVGPWMRAAPCVLWQCVMVLCKGNKTHLKQSFGGTAIDLGVFGGMLG